MIASMGENAPRNRHKRRKQRCKNSRVMILQDDDNVNKVHANLIVQEENYHGTLLLPNNHDKKGMVSLENMRPRTKKPRTK